VLPDELIARVFTEQIHSVVSRTDWLRELGYAIFSGQDALPAAGAALRATYGDVVLPGALRSTLHRLNRDLPAEALDEAFRKLSRPQGPTSEVRNRAVYRLLVDGVTVGVGGGC